MSDQDFEQRFAQLLTDYAEHGVRPFDAVEIAHLAASAPSGPAAVVARQRHVAPAWFRSLVLAGLLVLMLVALAFAGGFVRLPTGIIEPSLSPRMTIGDVTPDPSATLGPPQSPLPTFIAGPTPSPGITPTPGVSPTPDLTARPEPTGEPTIPPTLEPTIGPTPTAEPTSVPLIAVEAGDTHACAIRTDRTIACWGFNGFGELGNGTASESWVLPVTVSGINDALAVAAGNRFTCAIRAGGSVWCWGENLGDDDFSTTPQPVPDIADATAITAGGAHACALRANGSIACWGLGQLGQLGNGTIIHNSGNPVPVAVDGIADALGISAGWNHTCALRADASVWCWGGNGDGATGYGQLGDGTLDNRPSPVAVTGITDATGVAAGGWSSCALLADRSVNCWGYNGRGGLGDGSTTDSSVPVGVVGLADAVQVTVGGWHGCALRADGEIACWGANSDGGSGFGQLGSGDRADHPVPVAVVGIGDGRALSAAWISTCTIRDGDNVWCWGPGSGSEQPWQIPIPPAGALEQPSGMVPRTQPLRGA